MRFVVATQSDRRKGLSPVRKKWFQNDVKNIIGNPQSRIEKSANFLHLFC